MYITDNCEIKGLVLIRLRNEHHHWSLMFADERTRDLNIFLNVDHQLKRQTKFEFCSD